MHLLQSVRSTFNYLFCSKVLKDCSKNKRTHILYKIVDSFITSQEEEFYKVQCINTKALIKISIQNLVFDFHILHGLHPVQSCFIGIEYIKIITMLNQGHHKIAKEFVLNHSTCRYGTYNLLYQNRQGFLGFENIFSGEQFLMDPKKLALSQDFIEEFDAAQSFYIGIQAGLKFNYTSKPAVTLQNGIQFKHLRLVKAKNDIPLF